MKRFAREFGIYWQFLVSCIGFYKYPLIYRLGPETPNGGPLLRISPCNIQRGYIFDSKSQINKITRTLYKSHYLKIQYFKIENIEVYRAMRVHGRETTLNQCPSSSWYFNNCSETIIWSLPQHIDQSVLYYKFYYGIREMLFYHL